MSTLKVNSIQHSNGTDALTIDSTGHATFNKTFVPANPLTNRNIIINGDMRIAQRGTSATGVTNNYATCDRFFIRNNNLGAFTITQDTNAPDGFGNSLKWDCTTADASPAAGDFANLQHRIEAQNLQHLAFGTSNAKQFTVSFWVKSSETGNAVLRATNIDGSVAQGHLYTISSANTWEYKTITFTADTSNAFNNDNGTGLTLYWWLGAGSDRTSGTLRTTTWESSTVTVDEAVGQTINIASTVGSYINITGVQLEVGDTATPFEHRPYDMELARCQRYYITWCEGSNKFLGISNNYTSTTTYVFMDLPVTMRTTPSLDHVTGTDYYRSLSNNIGDNFNNLNLWGQSNINSVGLFVNTNLSVTQGYAGMVITNNTAAYIGFSAEL